MAELSRLMEVLESHPLMSAATVVLLVATAAVIIWTRVRGHGWRRASAPPETRAPATTESDDTVGAGNDTATQFDGHRTDQESAYLVIGLDFGTSCTKVIVRSPYMARSRAVAIPWRHDGRDTVYLLPTALYRNGRGELELAATDDATGDHFTDLKTALMDRPDDERARALAAAYLGVTLRTTRRWLLNNQADIYGQYFLRWALNLGIPSAGYDDEQVRATFGLVARAAWELSLESRALTLETAVRACRDAKGDGNPDADTPIEVVPEIVAEVVGYARSKRRRNGLHIVVDVGASTLDICGFNLHAPDGEDCYELLTALVERLGLNELHRKRVAAIRQAGARTSSRAPVTALDPSSPIPVCGSDYVEQPSSVLREELTAVDDRHVLYCTNALMRVLMALKQHRYRRADAWKLGLPVFLAGGGRDFELIRKAMIHANKRFTEAVVAREIQWRRLPAPETLADNDVPNGRLDVAYGLSLDRFDIGEIHPPGEIPDDEPPAISTRPDYPSKDVAQ